MMNLDWSKLGFSYIETKSHIRYRWRNGQWGEGELVSGEPYLNIHIAATALHYGQAAFEGLKAFACKDGKVRVFRLDENQKRMAVTASRILMPEVPESMFREAVLEVVRDNIDYVPPYGTGGSLYIRPLLIGTGPRIGVQPADEYIFLVLVIPVGNYYKGGLQPVSALIIDGYDRTAPCGLGNVKVAGNYAASLEPQRIAKEKGFPINLYLDPAQHKYIDEFGTSNFIAIDSEGRYVTPDSPSILPSITNKTLQQLAREKGIEVCRRPILLDEVETFREVAACGTAVVITPVNRIVYRDREIRCGSPDDQGVGPIFRELYHMVRGIQVGEIEDKWGWLTEV
ncbi:MAG: branched-chain amino acid aminotransferase [Lentisphaerae bacterium]|nr:MAG: branched-chain amino acid aminotransferase [Lentisphaerota bacterium]